MSTPEPTPSPTARYAPLGLIANPFKANPRDGLAALSCEKLKATTLLLNALEKASNEPTPKPLWAQKRPDLAYSHAIGAEAGVESVLAVDDELNILHAYVPLMTAKVGMTRATLNIVSERLVYRDLETTLARYLERILVEPDDSLTSFAVMGAERLSEFSARLSEDPVEASRVLFGQAVLDRRPELGEIMDPRLSVVEAVEDGESDSPELDQSLGEAPANMLVLQEETPEPVEGVETWSDVRDYVIEHTKAHLSPVVARALRVYCDRGQFAMASELMITKAPRKTLAAVVQLATARFKKVAIIYDDFEQWTEIDDEQRSKLVGAFSEIRWAHKGDSIIVMLMAPGEAPELDETFAGATMVDWSFSGIDQAGGDPETFSAELVDSWLAAATLDGRQPMDASDGVLQRLAAESVESFSRFIALAYAAIESAADRGVTELDDAAFAAALESIQQQS